MHFKTCSKQDNTREIDNKLKIITENASRNNVSNNRVLSGTFFVCGIRNNELEILCSWYRLWYSWYYLKPQGTPVVRTFLISAKMFLIPCVLWTISGTFFKYYQAHIPDDIWFVILILLLGICIEIKIDSSSLNAGNWIFSFAKARMISMNWI